MPTKTKNPAAPKPQAPKIAKVKTVLVSQPKPERSPYVDIEAKYGLTVDFRSFIQVEGYTEKDFRRQRIRIEDFPCVVFTSKNAIENFFRLAEEMRARISEMTKYFCSTEAVANYLQKFIVYRKRKVFHGVKSISELLPYFIKHRESGPFLIPCAETGGQDAATVLKEAKVKYQEALMYRTISADLSDLKDIKYDVLCFFSQLDIKSLYDNFPDFVQENTRIATFGKAAAKAVLDAGLRLDIQAPTPEFPSMAMALGEYCRIGNK
ncbi:MAG TPA: uroporphyrinogen-III synthase [Saprospiraceae bacterium]|nr:uroporphyrinogen-III synthase [Saprospiraceae bacterium]